MMRNRRLSLLLKILSYALAVAYGIGIVRWHIPPYGLYVRAKQIAGIPRYLGPEAELLVRHAFVDPLVEPEGQVDPPVRDLAGLSERVRGIGMGVDDFLSAYERAGKPEGSMPRPGLFALSFELDGVRKAWCYLEKGDPGTERTAILFIPGSGYNQAYEVVKGSEPNYHDGFLEAARKHGDVYVYIKPNEDVRAIHDGRRKLSYDFVVNTLVGHGRSYSAGYIAETIALAKHLKEKYARVVVAGVSQGGTAALLNGLQSWPDAVIAISPGFLPMPGYVYHASPYNIMIPGLFDTFSPEGVRDRIRSHETRWLFTFGKGETGWMRIAYEGRWLDRMYEGVEQVAIGRHPGGHEVPASLVGEYLGRLPAPER